MRPFANSLRFGMRSVFFGAIAMGLLPAAISAAAEVSGILQQWHPVEVRFTGPAHAETDTDPNPFLDHRLQCAFDGPSGRTYSVPGFFDTDGQGGSSGDQWICRFAPDAAGTWNFTASFRSGTNAAIAADAQTGIPTWFDGETDSFEVAPSDKTGSDFRSAGHGTLVDVGDHYLTFLGSGERWLKGGPNIPENLLGYTGFDDTPNAGHDFASHANDWKPGDPDWGNQDGRALIGALNYIAATGANVIYFLPMNIGGDGEDTFPTIAPQDKTHYDTSKLRQWEAVFAHAQSLGIFLHFQLAETEPANEDYHDDGQLGVERKLYYRELVARFGHHPGLEWDLGEENDYGTARHRVFAAHLKSIDAYDHPVTTHIHTNQMDAFYAPLLGNRDFDMTAFQLTESAFQAGDAVSEWRERSKAAGVPWVISIDEPQSIQNDAGDENNGYPHGRREFLWPTFMSGGGGFEWYVQSDGGGHAFDHEINDFRDMDSALTWTGYALEFMRGLPYWSMTPRADLASSTAGGKTFVLARSGDSFALYNQNGGALGLDLSAEVGTFAVDWFNPRTGVWYGGGTVQGGAVVDLGSAPFTGDVAARIERTGDGTSNAAPVARFTATPLSGEAPLRVRLDASASFDDGSIETFLWDFGDGTNATGPLAEVVYDTAGNYALNLQLVDDLGAVGQASQTIAVSAPTEPQPSGYEIVFSTSSDRANPIPLTGETVAGPVYVFVEPASGIAEANFYFDGLFEQREEVAPHDLAGGSIGTANPFLTVWVHEGPHTLDAVLTLDDNSQTTTSATFVVENGPDSEVPEPAFGLQLGVGLFALAWLARRRGRNGSPGAGRG